MRNILRIAAPFLFIVLPFSVAGEVSDGFTAKCESKEVHRYDSQVIWDGSVDRHWSTDEKCCSVTVVYTGGKTIVIDGNVAQPAPVHKVSSLTPTATQEFTIVWPTVVGANYQIESSTDLINWSNEGGEISPLTTTTAIALTGADPKNFYRIIRLR